MRTLPRLSLFAAVLTMVVLAVAPAARAQDPMAPPGAEKHWLPVEPWVNDLWLPYEEERLYRLLGRTRGEVFRWVRVDAHNTMAQLARRRGWTVARLSAALVEPRRGEVPAAMLATLRRRAALTLTQGHLGQHLLFHALHQTAIPSRATTIFGVRSREQFLKLRRSELSPLQIGELFGRARVDMQRGCVQALRDAAARGVRRGELPPRQAQVMLDRQIRQVPRWLGQNRYNGPSGGRNRLRLPAGDVAKHPTITADGRRAAWDAYRSVVAQAERLGEIHVRGADLAMTAHPRERAPRGFPVSPPVDPRSQKPRSSYNAVLSAGGGAVAFESAESTYPLAKRVGQMSVWVRDLGSRAIDKVSHAGLPPGAPTRTAFNPSLSADARLVAFEATDSGRGGRPSRNGLWVFDRTSRRQTLIAEHDGRGGAYLPRVTADGTAVAYTAVDPRTQVTQVLLRRLGGPGEPVLVSRAGGVAGDAADSDAYEPAVSRDGAVIAFTSRARNLGTGGRRSRVWVRDLAAGTTHLVSTGVAGDVSQPAISADGRSVAFVERLAIGDGTPAALRSRIWVADLATGATTLVSRDDGPGGTAADGASTEPALSADGSRIVFTSTAGNLSSRKPRGLAGVFVRDLKAQTTTLLSDHGRRRGTPRARIAQAPGGAPPGICRLP